ncbi:hypothetical protein [Tabrizicola sp.]|uniref:hypothetical protein n=1 Tax=Tabrizicola sp. TaxID=2005166 RepID=UPI003F36ACC7
MNTRSTAVSNPVGQQFRFWGRNTNTSSPGQYKAKADDFVGSFYAVLNRWRSETKFLSDPAKIALHPSYAALVENAEKVIPLIKMELSREPSHLIWVLEDHFGTDPYSPGDEGNVAKQTNRWLSYLDANG